MILMMLILRPRLRSTAPHLQRTQLARRSNQLSKAAKHWNRAFLEQFAAQRGRQLRGSDHLDPIAKLPGGLWPDATCSSRAHQQAEIR